MKESRDIQKAKRYMRSENRNIVEESRDIKIAKSLEEKKTPIDSR
jgi:hypothetical protein